MAHASRFGIGLKSVPEGLRAEDERGNGRHFPIDEHALEDAVRTGAEAPLLVRLHQVPMKSVIGVVTVDTATHALDTQFGEVHARCEETYPFRVGSGVQAAFPQRLTGLFHRHGGNGETVLEIRHEGGDGFGTRKVHDDGAETVVFLEGKHGEGPVQGVEVPGRKDESDLGHSQQINHCKDSEKMLNL